MRLIYWIRGPRKYCTDSDFAKKGVKVSTTITDGMIGVMDAMPEKINVLQFPIGNTKGGVTHYALNNWKFIDKSKFHFDFATMSHYLSIEQDIKATGAGVHHITEYAEKNPEKFYDEFCHILKQGKYDVVHLHTSHWKSMVAEKAVKEMGIPYVIIHAHNGNVTAAKENMQFEMERHLRLRNELREEAGTGYWACSYLAADFLFGSSIPKDKIIIMKNAIELEPFKFNRQVRKDMRDEFGLSDRDRAIGCVGRFAYQKNQGFLLRVMKKLHRRSPGYKLVLVGDGADLDSCREYVKENNLESAVIFTGYRTDVNRLMMAFDSLAMPSHFEGLPITLIEAQATGLMCYTSEAVTREVGVTENIEFLPLIEEVWADKLLEIREIEREKMSMKIAEAGYDIIKQIKTIENNYRGGTRME